MADAHALPSLRRAIEVVIARVELLDVQVRAVVVHVRAAPGDAAVAPEGYAGSAGQDHARDVQVGRAQVDAAQIDGTPRPRCGSFARSGRPVAVWAPEITQLLLPRAVSVRASPPAEGTGRSWPTRTRSCANSFGN